MRNRNLYHREQGLNLLLAGKWVAAGGGLLASRIVLVEWEPGQKWSTHLEVEAEKGSRSLMHGHYFEHCHHEEGTALARAAKDWELRERAMRRADRHCSQAEEMS